MTSWSPAEAIAAGFGSSRPGISGAVPFPGVNSVRTPCADSTPTDQWTTSLPMEDWRGEIGGCCAIPGRTAPTCSALTSRQPIIHLCAPLHLSVRRATSLLPQPPVHRARRGENRGCRGGASASHHPHLQCGARGFLWPWGRRSWPRPWDWTPVAGESLAGLVTPPLGHLLPWSDTFKRAIEVMISPLCLPGFLGRVALVTSGFV